MSTAEEVLAYWFGTGADAAAMAELKAPLWWGKSDVTDRDIASRFGETLDRAIAGQLAGWAGEPRSLLAMIVVLDQFSRVVFRGTPRAFAQDPIAQDLTAQGLARGWDRTLQPIERVFLYMPFEHAEDPKLQERSVALFAALARDCPEHAQTTFDNFHQFAIRHRDIVIRFGRFPHRNGILGRASTAEEADFLTQPNSGF